VADANSFRLEAAGAEQQPARTTRESATMAHSDTKRLSKPEPESSQEQPAGAGVWTCSAGPCRWPVEPDVGRVAYGVSNRVDRIRGLGNAIVPQVAAEILRAILIADQSEA
jgi:DNA (cytosine-5)-methyltransferase 1